MGCGCPDGYIRNADTGLCDRFLETDAVLASAPVLPPVLCTNSLFCRYGTAVYSTITPDQYPLTENQVEPPTFTDALGAVIAPSVTLVGGDLWVGGSKTKGRLNQAGIGLLPPLGQWQGYSNCLNVEEGDLYSVAVAASYGFKITIDNQVAVVYTPIPYILGFNYLHVFTFQLSEGLHNVLVEGLSGDTLGRSCFDQYGSPIPCANMYAVSPPVDCPNLGAFAFEIYKNVTAQILANISTQNELNDYYAIRHMNSSGQYITSLLLSGSPTDTGSNGNYVCAGNINSCTEGVMKCQILDTQSYTPCCFKLINCATGAIIISNTDLNAYQDKIVKIGGDECYAININSDPTCAGAIAVTVSEYFDTCEICTRVYSRLVDCQGVHADIVTYTDLSEYEGKIISIAGSDRCWMISQNISDIENAVEIEIVESFDDCEDCL